MDTIAVCTVAIVTAIVLFASGPLVATNQAQAQKDVNPATGNPHSFSVAGDPATQTGTETDNPHIGPCTGNPHGQIAAEPGVPPSGIPPEASCHGSQ